MSGKMAELGRNGAKVFLVYKNQGQAMNTLKISLIASCIGTAVGLSAWVFGLGRIIWPAHPQVASFLLTLVTTIVIQIAWPRLTETDRR
jgi:hypothetical protein